MSPDTALRVAAVFGSTPAFWMNLQANYDLWFARRKAAKESKRLHRVVSRPAA